MAQKTADIIEYLTVVISCFAKHYSISTRKAYAYLKKYLAIDSIIEHYDGLHTLSLDDAVDFAAAVCRNNGGEMV